MLCRHRVIYLAIPKIAYVDTDAYILVFDNGIDPYQMIREHSEHFDTSNFPVGNQFNIEQKYKKISGKYVDTGSYIKCC
jgi:hypothetical protein